MPKFAGVELTEESILKTRKLFADNAMACIEEAKAGVFHVNDLQAYIVWEETAAKDYMDGKSDHTLTFLQRAHFIQTGECIALLP